MLPVAALGASCASVSIDDPPPETTPVERGPGPGEACEPVAVEQVKPRFEPNRLILAPGQRRTAKVVVDPDFCDPETITFTSSDETVHEAPADAVIDYGLPTAEVEIVGGAVGETTITVMVPTPDETIVKEAILSVHVLDPTLNGCDSSDDIAPVTLLADDAGLHAGGSLLGASITLPATADRPNDNAFVWSVQPFETSLRCADDILPDGYKALGTAVTFGPTDRTFPRDLPLSLPINPARMPEAGRLRHLMIAHSSPKFREPRVMVATDLQIVQRDDGWRLNFRAPRLGTYQAVVLPNAGTIKRTRRITHRAVIGLSMGGAGTQMFGFRNHHLFDVIAPMGGPVDWTWFMDHLENNHLGGFRPIAPGTQLADIQLTKTPCTTDGECLADETCLGGGCTLMPVADEPYEHPSTYNNWWYEFPGQGHGGSFDREEYTQIFRDLTLMFGNPNSFNPDHPNLPRGVDPTHPAQAGTDGDCYVYVKPISGDPDEEAQQEKFSRCPADRCQYTQTFQGYYDAKYNPDGTFDVITFCDGSRQIPENTPWANTWNPDGNNFPSEVALRCRLQRQRPA